MNNEYWVIQETSSGYFYGIDGTFVKDIIRLTGTYSHKFIGDQYDMSRIKTWENEGAIVTTEVRQMLKELNEKFPFDSLRFVAKKVKVIPASIFEIV